MKKIIIPSPSLDLTRSTSWDAVTTKLPKRKDRKGRNFGSESEDATLACSLLALLGWLDRTFTLNNRGCLLKGFESKAVY